MDLAVRASLNGWKFVYVPDLEVKTELPSTFKALRYQQHRWSCGPANLFRKMGMEIMMTTKVNWWQKLYLFYSFFLVRKIVAHIVAFVFSCVVMPATVLFPEVEAPKWEALFCMTAIILLLNAVGTPRLNLLELCVGFYIFFCGCVDMAYGKNHYFLFLFPQSIAFLIAGVGYVGTIVLNS